MQVIYMKILQIFGIFLLFAGMVCAAGANENMTAVNAVGAEAENTATTTAVVSAVNVAVVGADSTVMIDTDASTESEDGSTANAEKERENENIEPLIEYIDYSREFSIVLNPKSIVVDMYYGTRIYDPCGIQLLYDDSTEKAECNAEGYVQIIYSIGEQPKVIKLGESSREAEETTTSTGYAGIEETTASTGGYGEEKEDKPSQAYAEVMTSEKSTQTVELVKVEVGEIHGIEVTQEVAVSAVSVAISTTTGTSAMEVTTANGKVVLSTDTTSVETNEKIVVDEEKNLLYIESEGSNYQIYLNPEDAMEIVEEKGYEPSVGAELVMSNNIPVYKINAKKPVKFLWFTISEEEVVLSVDQTGKVVEEVSIDSAK
ncbi:hypothetical protein KAW38_02565 [Candidatus Micrarchaeota archaeon]|nr:hypothetical protein [Candidatus Micrarchaeota archaeon]